MGIINFFVTADTFVKIRFKGFDYYMKPDGEVTFGLFSYIFGLFFGPMKVSIIADILCAIFFGLAQNWASLAFYTIMLIPSSVMEFGVFSALPFLDVPYIEWGKVFGIETDELYEGANANPEPHNATAIY